MLNISCLALVEITCYFCLFNIILIDKIMSEMQSSSSYKADKVIPMKRFSGKPKKKVVSTPAGDCNAEP